MTVTPDLSSYLLGSQLNITCRSDSFFSTGTPLRFRWTRDRQRINDGITEVLEPGLYRGQKLTSVYTSTVAIAHDNTVVQCVPDFDNFLNFLYRVDLKEQVARLSLNQDQEKYLQEISLRILLRELEKIRFRNKNL